MASYFAVLGALNVVSHVIVIEPEVAARGQHGSPAGLVQTYIDGSQRGRYAGPGMTFDPLNTTFTASALAGPLGTPVSPLDSRGLRRSGSGREV